MLSRLKLHRLHRLPNPSPLSALCPGLIKASLLNIKIAQNKKESTCLGFCLHRSFSAQNVEAFLSPKEFSDFRWDRVLVALRGNDFQNMLKELNQMKGLRQGFTLRDSKYVKFAAEFPDKLKKMNPLEIEGTLEVLYQIGIKDIDLYGDIYDFIRKKFDSFSFNTLLHALSLWDDHDMFGYRMVLEDELKIKFLNKTKALLPKLTAEDLVICAYMLDSWGAPIHPLIERIKDLDYDNMNSKKTVSVNTFPKLVHLLCKYNLEEDAMKILEMVPILTTVTYEQMVQSFELNEAYQRDVGVYDPLHWKSIALYAEALRHCDMNTPAMMHYIETAIERKMEVQILDFTNGPAIIYGQENCIRPMYRLMIFQMLNIVIQKEKEFVTYQLSPQKLLLCFKMLRNELNLAELSNYEMGTLFNEMTKLLVDGEFDGQLEDDPKLEEELKEVFESIAENDTLALKAPLDYLLERKALN